jgi:hypothetical protein
MALGPRLRIRTRTVEMEHAYGASGTAGAAARPPGAARPAVLTALGPSLPGPAPRAVRQAPMPTLKSVDDYDS